MQGRPNLQAPVTTESAPSADVRTEYAWEAEAAALLKYVAAMCIAHDVDAETFMHSAWSTYVDARPGMREELEAAQLVAQLAALREAGRMGQA